MPVPKRMRALSTASSRSCTDTQPWQPDSLVRVLEPVAPGKHLETPRVVWYIRALRSLTGLDFKAPTKARLTDDQRERLHPDTAGNTPFFTRDMGWDVIWVAPKDAQLAIIRKWRAWFATEGKTFKYVNDRNHKDWYF